MRSLNEIITDLVTADNILPYTTVTKANLLRFEAFLAITDGVGITRLEEICKAEADGRLVIKEKNSNFYKCKNCRHLSPSENTNRLYCSYHSENGNEYETSKDDYCSDFERLEEESQYWHDGSIIFRDI